MTSAVYRGRKASNQSNKHKIYGCSLKSLLMSEFLTKVIYGKVIMKIVPIGHLTMILNYCQMAIVLSPFVSQFRFHKKLTYRPSLHTFCKEIT